MSEQDIEQGNLNLRDADRIKTSERRCIKVCRMTIETFAFLIGIITLCLMGIIPISKKTFDREKYIQSIMCIVINLIISFVRITYNLILCNTDREGDRSCFIIINSVIGFCLLIWLLEILISTYVLSYSITSLFILFILSTYFIINCWNVYRVKYAM
jgi:hypothetical protein